MVVDRSVHSYCKRDDDKKHAIKCIVTLIGIYEVDIKKRFQYFVKNIFEKKNHIVVFDYF